METCGLFALIAVRIAGLFRKRYFSVQSSPFWLWFTQVMESLFGKPLPISPHTLSRAMQSKVR